MCSWEHILIVNTQETKLMVGDNRDKTTDRTTWNFFRMEGAIQVLLFAELCRAAGWPYPKAHTWMQVFEDSRKLAHIPNGVHCAGKQFGFKSCYTTHSFHIHLQQVTTLLSQMRRVHIV